MTSAPSSAWSPYARVSAACAACAMGAFDAAKAMLADPEAQERTSALFEGYDQIVGAAGNAAVKEATTVSPEVWQFLKDWLKRKFDEASAHVDLDQLGIAPQCGFSSTEHGNALTEDDQWRKLERVVELAQDIWGTV